MSESSRQRSRTPRRLASAVAVCVLAVTSMVISATPAFAATVGLDKTSSVETVQPGDEFIYTLVPRCSGLTEACINAVVTDTLPPELEVTAIPPSRPEYTVAFDPATRVLRIQFRIQLPAPSPAGSVGLPAGSSSNIQIGVRVPAESQVTDGTVITNTASVVADNAPAVSGSDDVTAEVPRVVRPVATKSWTDGSAVAG